MTDLNGVSRMKNAMLTASLTAAILVGATTQVIASSGGHRGPHHSFEELDADGDGRITQEEMATHMQARFKGADTDGNGSLSRDELLTRMKERQAERGEKYIDHMMERHDANDDGELSLEEMRDRGGNRMFARFDTDGDGAISAEEFEAMTSRHRHGKHKQNGDATAQ